MGTKKSPLKIDVLTLFPKMFLGPMSESMIRLAQKKKLAKIQVHDLRKWTHDVHKTCDDKPFGGGPGMVMKIEPIFEALKAIRKKGKVILTSPRGKPFNHKMAKSFAKEKHLIVICGHYEGVDERVHEHLIDLEVSVGDFIMTGGELAAMCMIDAAVRLIPGVLGNEDSLNSESFGSQTLEYPQYTRPSEFRGWKVPDVLRSGDHLKIKAWRDTQAARLTKELRPDLVE